MEAVLVLRLGDLEPPGLSLKVLVNPKPAELERYTKDRGYPHVLRCSATTAWDLSSVRTAAKTVLDSHRTYPLSELMWHGLVVVDHAQGDKECKVSVYGARFVG